MKQALKKSCIALAIAAGTMVAGSASAALVTQWEADVSTAWTGATFTAGGGAQTVNATEISWGLATGNLGTAPNGGRSGIVLSGGGSGILIDTDAAGPTATGTVTHTNNPISSAFATLATATLQTTLQLTAFNPAGPPLPPDTITFNINFKETPNTAGTCVPEATTVCDDIFVIASGNLNNSFEYDGFEYFVSIVTLTGNITPLSNAACAAAGAASGCLGFVTPESASTPVEFGIRITSKPIGVPEPGALALFGIALAGAAAMRRRRPEQ